MMWALSSGLYSVRYTLASACLRLNLLFMAYIRDLDVGFSNKNKWWGLNLVWKPECFCVAPKCVKTGQGWNNSGFIFAQSTSSARDSTSDTMKTARWRWQAEGLTNETFFFWDVKRGAPSAVITITNRPFHDTLGSAGLHIFHFHCRTD